MSEWRLRFADGSTCRVESEAWARAIAESGLVGQITFWPCDDEACEEPEEEE